MHMTNNDGLPSHSDSDFERRLEVAMLRWGKLVDSTLSAFVNDIFRQERLQYRHASGSTHTRVAPGGKQ